MKSFLKTLMGVTIFLAAVAAALSHFKKFSREQKYIVIDENREELF